MVFIITHHPSLNTPQGYAATYDEAIFRNPETHEVRRSSLAVRLGEGLAEGLEAIAIA